MSDNLLEKRHTRHEALEFGREVANLVSAAATGDLLREIMADPAKKIQIAAALDEIMFEARLPTATVDTPHGPEQVVLLADAVSDGAPAVSERSIEFHGPDGSVVAKAVPLANGGFDPKRVAAVVATIPAPTLSSGAFGNVPQSGRIEVFRTAAESPSDHDEAGWPNSAL